MLRFCFFSQVALRGWLQIYIMVQSVRERKEKCELND